MTPPRVAASTSSRSNGITPIHLDPRHPIESLQSSVRFARSLPVGAVIREAARVVSAAPSERDDRRTTVDGVEIETVAILGDAEPSPSPPTVAERARLATPWPPAAAPTAPPDTRTGTPAPSSTILTPRRLSLPFFHHHDAPYDARVDVSSSANAGPNDGPVSSEPVARPIHDAAIRPDLPLVAHLHARGRFFAAIAAIACITFATGERAHLRKILSTFHLSGASLAESKAVAGAEVTVSVTTPPCPDDMALVQADEVRVCVDRFEGSLVETVDGVDRAHSPYSPVDGHDVRAVSREGVIPQAYISRDQAEVACEASGKRLCEPVEWRTACEGPTHTVYPYGDSEDQNACNTHGRAPLGVLFGGYGDLRYDFRVMNDPSLNALDGTVAKTGSYSKCTSGFGVHDMVGNVHEWTAERAGTFRGGYYLDTHLNGDGCRYQTTAHAASYHDYSTGFRCCKDAASGP